MGCHNAPSSPAAPPQCTGWCAARASAYPRHRRQTLPARACDKTSTVKTSPLWHKAALSHQQRQLSQNRVLFPVGLGLHRHIPAFILHSHLALYHFHMLHHSCATQHSTPQTGFSMTQRLTASAAAQASSPPAAVQLAADDAATQQVRPPAAPLLAPQHHQAPAMAAAAAVVPLLPRSWPVAPGKGHTRYHVLRTGSSV